MKVSDLNNKVQLDAYLNQTQTVQNQQQNNVQASTQSNQSDKVELSAGSRLLQGVKSAMETQEPDRAERIQALKQQVEQGTYGVNFVQVANSMMTDLLKDLG